MGTKLSEYLRGDSAADNAAGSARRAAFARAYSIAADLLELRLRRGLTQKDLASLTGIAQSEISRIERGAVHPTDTTWARLADALGADLRLVDRAEAPRGRPGLRRPARQPVAAGRGVLAELSAGPH